MDCLALATTLGFAWKAIPRPAIPSMGRSLAPSPTAIVCAISTFSTLTVDYITEIAAGQFAILYFQLVGIHIVYTVLLLEVLPEVGKPSRKNSYLVTVFLQNIH